MGKTFSCEVEVRWADLDLLGHVNNTKYLEYAMEARVKFFRAAFGVRELSVAGNRAVVLRKTDVDFIRPVLIESGPLTVEVAVTHVGNSSYSIRHTLIGSDGDVYALVNALMVGFDLDEQRSRPLHDNERKALQDYLVDAD